MRYYEFDIDGYINNLQKVDKAGIGNITEERYNTVSALSGTAPAAPEGYTYKLNAKTLRWNKVKLPDPEEEAVF